MAYNVQDEVWGEYAAGMAFLLLRLYARWKLGGGFRGFRIDEAFTISAMLFYTSYTIMGNLIAIIGSSIGLTEHTAALLDHDTIDRYTIGSKILFAAWFQYVCFVWSLKSILITLYYRMTEGLPAERRFLNMITVFAGLSWVTCVLVHLCQCTPIQRNWQVYPYPGDNCAARNLNYWVIGILNITTDASIIVVPLPILAKAKLSAMRRLTLGLLLTSGVFIIICSLLRTYYSLRDISLLETALGWAGRETLVASIAVSAPAIKPLFNGLGWLHRSSVRTSNAGGNSKESHGMSDQYMEMRGGVGSSKPKAKTIQSQWHISKADSEEHIVRNSNENSGIQVTTEYVVDTDTPPSARGANHFQTGCA